MLLVICDGQAAPIAKAGRAHNNRPGVVLQQSLHTSTKDGYSCTYITRFPWKTFLPHKIKPVLLTVRTFCGVAARQNSLKRQATTMPQLVYSAMSGSE